MSLWQSDRWIDEAMAEPTDLSNPKSTSLLASVIRRNDIKIAPFDEDLAVGQIRMMPSWGEGGPPLVLAILVERPPAAGDDRVLVAPFSKYPVPASPTEWLCRDHLFYSTLSAWSTRFISRRVMSQSWVIDELDREERVAAKAVFKLAMFGENVPPALIPQTGLPIPDSDDPRVEFQEIENRRFSRWITAAEAHCKTVVDELSHLRSRTQKRLQAAAAEIEDRVLVNHKWGGYNFRFFSRNYETGELSVYKEDEFELSNDFEGASLEILSDDKTWRYGHMNGGMLVFSLEGFDTPNPILLRFVRPDESLVFEVFAGNK